MPNLVSAATVRAQIPTRLSDAQLDALIEREEAAIIAAYGAAYVDANTSVTEIHLQEDGLSVVTDLFLRRRVLTVTTVTEQATLTSTGVVLVDGTDYVLLAGQGRLLRVGGHWGRLVTVAYVPQDDNAERTRIVIDLVRLALTRTGYQSESVAGEYSYQSANTDGDTQRARLLAQAGFPRA